MNTRLMEERSDEHKSLYEFTPTPIGGKCLHTIAIGVGVNSQTLRYDLCR